MNITIITLFPDFVNGVVAEGVVGRATTRGLMQLNCINPREFATDTHRTVDDRPYGGGPGMVLRPDCLVSAIRQAKSQAVKPRTIYLSPQGQPLTQSKLRELGNLSDLILVCGRYEGIDERVIDLEVDEELSLGDYVLSGGELAAMVVIDGVTRLLPEVLGHQESAEEDSFTNGILDHPHYTRPESFEGLEVPEVLLSGNHQRIRRWRRQQALGRTNVRRSELVNENELSEQDQLLLADFMKDIKTSEVKS